MVDKTALRVDGYRPQYMLESPSTETLDAIRPRPGKRRSDLQHHAWRQVSNVNKLTRPILGARPLTDRGQALVEVIADLPEERRALGPTGLTETQLFTVFCEDPNFAVEFEHEGEMYDAVYDVGVYAHYTTPRPSLYALSSTCTGALLASHGDIDGAIGNGCSREDRAAHFPNPSNCRACLLIDGDHDRCVAENRCKAQANREMFVHLGDDAPSYDVLEMEGLACAPSFIVDMFVLAHEIGEDNTMPIAFDHDAIHGICSWHWNTGTGGLVPFCAGHDGRIRINLGDIVMGRVDSMTRRRDGAVANVQRLFFASSIEVEGRVLESFPNTSVSSYSESRDNGGWGMHPNQLRADGTDPNNIDHTFARDWISAVTMKTATTRNGVPYALFNRNLCAEDSWRGPDANGRYYCEQPFWDATNPPPDERRWSYDWAAINGFTPTAVVLYPHVTLASTGLMDPRIPGGHVSSLMGSELLGDPDWDNCTWADTFVADAMLNFNTRQPEGVHTFTSQTYKFGKDRLDIRAVLATNQRRGYCAPNFPED